MFFGRPFDQMGQKCRYLAQNASFWPNLAVFGPKIQFFGGREGANDHYTWGYNFPIGTTPKKISVSELGVIFWGSPLFLAVFGHSHFRGATTLNFGPISTKLGGMVRVIKKMTQKDNGPGPGRNYGETGVFTFGRKVVFGLKIGLRARALRARAGQIYILFQKQIFSFWWLLILSFLAG